MAVHVLQYSCTLKPPWAYDEHGSPRRSPRSPPSGNQDRQGAGGKRKETKKRRPPQGAQKRYAPTHDLTVSGRRSGDARARRAHTQTAQAPLAPTATFARLSAFRPHPATFVKTFAKVWSTPIFLTAAATSDVQILRKGWGKRAKKRVSSPFGTYMKVIVSEYLKSF